MARIETPKRIRGTQDIAFEEQRRFAHVLDTFERVRRLYCFQRIDIPVFEATAVFARSLGETTDVVSKEMYTFEDRGGDSITLRPEFTAGIARAYITEGWQQHAPMKIVTSGPVFRYERPQKGRFRQFHQIDAEVIGAAEPAADVELLVLADQLLHELGIAEGVTLQLNTLGDAETRDAWRAALVAHFEAHRGELSDDSVARLERNPLRILDSKDPRDRPIADSAPDIDAYLTAEARAFFDAVTAGLDAAGVAWTRNPRLVRGLDYYRHTAFEFVTERLGAQGTVLAGGRYDGLIGSLGGPETPGVGWAAGVERLAMLIDEPEIEFPEVMVTCVAEWSADQVIALVTALRQSGVKADAILTGSINKRYEKAQLRRPQLVLIVTPDESGSSTSKITVDVKRGKGGGDMPPIAAEGKALMLLEAIGKVEKLNGEQPFGADFAVHLNPMTTISPARIAQIEARRDELQALMATGDLPSDRFVAVSKEYAELEPVARAAGEVRRLRAELGVLAGMEQDNDPEIKVMAREEIEVIREKLPLAERNLALSLLPRDAADERAAMLEIRAGTGGDEAALFAGDLFRMYQKYAEAQGWRVELISASSSESGGFKEAIASVEGKGVFAKLKFESGVHRVQRVPATEAGGRIHTSAATVAVLPEAEDVDVQIDEARDLRIDIYRASGPGGQGVNTTDSAVRITHLPTGLVVIQQDERSQIKNKAKALKVLRSRLYEAERERLANERAGSRKSMVGSGDRSERIRTYNFPQGRVTDHRINLTLHRLPEILQGDMGELIGALISEDEAERLASLDA